MRGRRLERPEQLAHKGLGVRTDAVADEPVNAAVFVGFGVAGHERRLSSWSPSESQSETQSESASECSSWP